MNITLVDIEHSRVVLDGFIVSAHFGKAVSSVIEGLYILLGTKLNLVVVVKNGLLIPLYLPVHQTSVRIDNGVLVV
jgi:hypothetical protein